MDNRLKELLSNTLLFTIANLGSKVLVFLMVPLYTAVLTPAEYGISDIILMTTSLLYPILTICVVDAVLRYCFVKEVDTSQAFSFGIKVCLAGMLLTVLFCVLFARLSFFTSLGNYIVFVPVLFATITSSRFLTAFSRGIGKVRVSVVNGLLNTCLVISLNLFFLLVLKIGILGYLLSYVFADIVSIVYMSVKCDIKKYYTTHVSCSIASEMCKYSIPLIPNSLSWWFLSSFNRYLVLSILGISAVGIYSASLRIPTILTVISNIFIEAWLLSALNNYGTEESKAFIKSIYGKYFAILIVITAILILLSRIIAKLLLSGEFSNYWHTIPCLLISVFFGALVGFLGTIFSAEKKNSIQFISTMTGSFVSIAITYLLLESCGIIVVAISTMVGYFTIWMIRKQMVKKYIDIGMSITSSILQSACILLEAYFVMKEQYLLATISLIILVVFNYKTLNAILQFSLTEAIRCTKNRF